MTLSIKRKVNSRKSIALLSMLLAVAVVPASASAGSVHIDVPHIGISLHNSNSHYRRHKRSRRHHNRHHYKSRNYNSGYNYYTPRTRYYDRGYNSGYRSGYNSGYNYGNNYNNGDNYNSNYCPTPGYSSRSYRNRGCYSHGDHYHCD